MAEYGALSATPAVGAAILAGGKSRRMDADKAFLTFNGRTFLEHILAQVTAFPEILISAAPQQRYIRFGFPVIPDEYAEHGPIAGIYSVLHACRSPFLLVLSCDMPLFERALAEYLVSQAVNGLHDALILLTSDGRAQPLCAVYAKISAPVFLSQIRAGNNRLRDALALLDTRYIPLEQSGFPDTVLINVNTPEAYRALTYAPRRIQKAPPATDGYPTEQGVTRWA
jgi:molybdopterin-guanine dinucleotide biosynthesis protein A